MLANNKGFNSLSVFKKKKKLNYTFELERRTRD